MSRIIDLLRSEYRKLKSKKTYSKSAQEASERAKIRYKKESSRERAAAGPEIDFYSDVIARDDFPGSEKIPENRAKEYLRKSRRGEVSKKDVNDRINSKPEGLYSERKINVGNKNSRKRFHSNGNERIYKKSNFDFDEDVPF